MKPKISVVIPTYNRAFLVKQAVGSIIDQTFKDWECLVIDDGSEDNTQQLIKSIQDERVKYYKIPHCGRIGKVRNYGNKKAKGQLIVVQDADDISLPDRLDVLWQEYQITKADVLYHSMYMIVHFPQKGETIRKFRSARPFDKNLIIREQYIPGQVAYTKKAVMAVPYDERITVSDDWQILIELALKDYKFHSINRALYEYYYEPDSVTLNSVKDGRRKTDIKIIMEILRKKYKLEVAGVEMVLEKTATGEILNREFIR